VWPSRLAGAEGGARRRWLLDAAGAGGLVLILLLVWRSGPYSPFLYPGGMVLLSAGTAAVVAASVSPASRIGRALGWGPLRWLGVRSYGIYLWHYPIIVLTTPANGGEDLARGAAQLAASVAAAALSWRFVEEPVRHGAIGRLWARLRGGGWRAVPHRARAALGLTAAAAVVAGCGLAGSVPVASSGTPAETAASVSTLSGAPTGQTVDAGATSGAGGLAATPPAAGSGPRLLTSCRSVVHIGDSTSDGLVLPAYQPDAALRIAAQYQRVGVTTFIPEVSGARSIVETWHGFPNGYTVAEQLIDQGYHGCWVIALGTNDAADVAVGSNVGLAARIQRMMSLIGDQPVMWVNVVTLLASGPYAEANMRQWNQALLQACPFYPDMRVYDWAAVARPGWFIPDGIHYTPQGYAERSRLIADALAHAFPQSQPGWPGPGRMVSPVVTGAAVSSPAGCLVH
jgi:lysophospholipase L1-like esterase